MSSTGIQRRTFLEAAAAVTAMGTAVQGQEPAKKPANAVQEAREKIPANERILTALIGCGGMGRADLRDFLRAPEVEIVALCDVDTRRTADALKDVENAGHPTSNIKLYQDFRQVIDRSDVDVVIIGTPDHWHAIPLIFACQAGKDVYCEKPLSHNIVEGRAMVNASKKRVVQIGTQQRSGKHFQDAVAFVQSGALGKVHACRTWIINENIAPDGNGNPPDGEAPPEVDYNLWLGPAPLRPFNPVRFHYQYRWFQDYGNGLCNDWGVHLNDVVLWAMRVKSPVAVASSGGKYVLDDISDTPDTMEVVYDYPGFTHTYSIRRCTDRSMMRGSRHGIEFQGTNGTLVLTREGWEVLPDSKPGGGVRMPAEKHGSSDQHWPHVQNFIECIKTRQKTNSPIEEMHFATVTCHLANISLKVGRKIYWDAEAEKCRFFDMKSGQLTGEDTEANALLFREPRKPWTIPLG